MPCPKDFTRVDATGRARAGSQRQIQTYVNEAADALNSAVGQTLSRYGLNVKQIEWVSPLGADKYSEYRDTEFLERVGLGHLAPQLLKFWPQNGPCWDALARVDSGCLLVEAKSHVSEIYGGGCGACDDSRKTIQDALDLTKGWLGVSADVDWLGRLYQSANRYANLYFLREVARVQAHLVNVYFLGDPLKPTARQQWDVAIESVNRELGLVQEVPYSASLFLPFIASSDSPIPTPQAAK